MTLQEMLDHNAKIDGDIDEIIKSAIGKVPKPSFDSPKNYDAYQKAVFENVEKIKPQILKLDSRKIPIIYLEDKILVFEGAATYV